MRSQVRPFIVSDPPFMIAFSANDSCKGCLCHGKEKVYSVFFFIFVVSDHARPPIDRPKKKFPGENEVEPKGLTPPNRVPRHAVHSNFTRHAVHSNFMPVFAPRFLTHPCESGRSEHTVGKSSLTTTTWCYFRKTFHLYRGL